MTATKVRERRGPRMDTLEKLEVGCLSAAVWSQLDRLKAAAAGGVQDCYDATVSQLGFDPLTPWVTGVAPQAE